MHFSTNSFYNSIVHPLKTFQRSSFFSFFICSLTHSFNHYFICSPIYPFQRSRRNSCAIPSVSSHLLKTEEDEVFTMPRSKSELSGILSNPRSGIGNLISESSGPARSCSCGSFTGKNRSG
jgi:hypothetical protein